jgi:hypothetical protein
MGLPFRWITQCIGRSLYYAEVGEVYIIESLIIIELQMSDEHTMHMQISVLVHVCLKWMREMFSSRDMPISSSTS